MITDFIQNSALLIALTVLYGFLGRKRSTDSLFYKITGGFLFGSIAIAGMNMPVVYMPGIIYDGRSIVLVLAGLFGGGLTAGISVIVTGTYRLFLGGAGIWAGTATIVSAALIGLTFRRIYNNNPISLNVPELYGMGLLTHLVMLLCQLLLPWPSGLQMVSQIWIPVLLVFPVATLLMGVLLRNEKKRIIAETEIRESEELFRTTLHSIGDAVITTDKHGMIVFLNPVAEQVTGWKEAEVVGKSINTVFRIINEDSGEKVDCPVKKVLEKGIIVGLANHTLLISKQGHQIPIADSGAPIKNENGEITGVVLVFRDQSEERIMQRKVQESKRLFHTLAEHSPVGIFRTKLDGNTTYVNPRWCQLSGLSYNEAIGDGWLNAVHPDDRDKILKGWGYATHDYSGSIAEYRFQKPDGSQTWVIGAAVPETDLTGEVIGYIGTITDITKRKKAEEALLKSEKGYKNLFENHAAIKLLIDPHTGDIADANRAAKSFYGYFGNHLKQMNIREIAILSEDDYKKKIAIAENPKNIPAEYRHRLSDGSVRHVEVFTSRVEFKGKEYLHSIIHDITEKKLAESQLQLLSKSTEQSPVSIVITDPHGRIEYVNPKFTEISEYTRNEVIGRNPSIVKSGEHDEAFYQDLWNTIYSGRDWKGEFLNKKKNGERYWESAVISSIVDENGQITHFLAAKEDITEKKRIIADLQLAKEKAEESDLLKSTFLANMSHEIRTPLNAILGFSGMLSSDPEMGRKERLEYASIINESSDNLLQIINDILDVSKLETGQLKIYKKAFHVQMVLDELYTIFRKRLVETGQENVRLKVFKPASPILLNADKVRVSQILMNLLSNAIKFTLQGSVEFGIHGITELEVIFFVSDTGIGIKRELQTTIFERFRQADGSSTRMYGGTGLGLSIVKNLVELMDGHISLHSEEGKGTTFKFSLPALLE